jgi:hypothetical protein
MGLSDYLAVEHKAGPEDIRRPRRRAAISRDHCRAGVLGRN